MAYIFRGRLCGYFCEDCLESLSGLKVRLYRTRKDQNVTALAVSNPKDTISILTDENIKAKESFLIAETTIDDNGHFEFKLDKKQKYDGEAFEVDIYCETVPGLKTLPDNARPVQLSITILQPLWRRAGDNFINVWEYCIPWRVWCAVRARFGAWVICGHVLICNTQIAAAGVKVFAFDADWFQDDPLGSAVTDASGHFRIDYTVNDFNRTPFSPTINIELIVPFNLFIFICILH